MTQVLLVQHYPEDKEFKMKKFLETKYGGLIFSLLSGLAYFCLVLTFILETTGNKGILLGIFFFPAIVCGMGLVLLKGIKQWQEQENYSKITAVVILHVVLFIISIVSLVATVLF